MNNARYKIIMVDDNMANLTMGRNLLKSFYEVYPAPSGAKLFEILENVMPDLILLDIEMPEMNGYEALKKLVADPRYKDIPVIFLTAKNDENSEIEGFDLGATDYISKPFSGPLLLKRIENQLLIARQKKDLLSSRDTIKDRADNLNKEVHTKTLEVVKLQNAIVSAMADLVEFRDKFNGAHIARTQLYLKILIEAAIKKGTYAETLRKWDMEYFLLSAQLHDLGKIAVGDPILNKPGKLTRKEFEIMKTHVPVGVDVIEKIIRKSNDNTFLRHAALIAGTHHEKWDGTGYPVGLKGENIPLEGRLMALADVYDALVALRPYKESLTHEDACKVIEESAGTQFDPALVEVFKDVKGEFKRAAETIGLNY